MENPPSVTAQWLPEGRRRPSHHLSQWSGQLVPPSEGLHFPFSSLKQSLPLVLKCRETAAATPLPSPAALGRFASASSSFPCHLSPRGDTVLVPLSRQHPVPLHGTVYLPSLHPPKSLQPPSLGPPQAQHWERPRGPWTGSVGPAGWQAAGQDPGAVTGTEPRLGDTTQRKQLQETLFLCGPLSPHLRSSKTFWSPMQ